jgi:hypothetical protein
MSAPTNYDRLHYASGVRVLCIILDETLQDILDISMTETLSVVLIDMSVGPINQL